MSEHTPTVLETIFGSYSFDGLKLMNGKVYASQYATTPYFNPHVTVFDVASVAAGKTREIRTIAHFAAPGVGTVCPLQDGRALVGGMKVWSVGAPTEHRNN